MAQDIGSIGRHPGWNAPNTTKTERANGKEKAQQSPQPQEAPKTREDSVSITRTAAVERLQQALSNIEDHYNSQIDAIKNSDSYKQALEDLKNGKGVSTTASGSTMYHGQSQEGVPDYVIFDGRIFLAAESGGYWAVSSGYGDIPADVEIKAPKEGEEGYGACKLEKSEPAGRDLRAFLKDQATASETWREMLKGLTGNNGKNWNFNFGGNSLQGLLRLQTYSQTTVYGKNSQTGSAFWASQTTYSETRAWYSLSQKTQTEE